MKTMDMKDDNRLVWWFLLEDGKLLLEQHEDGTLGVPCATLPPVVLRGGKGHYVGELDGLPCMAARPEGQIAEGGRHVMMGLRLTYDVLPACLYQRAGKAEEILYWDEHTRYCGVCGAPMQLHTDISKCCTACGQEVWPQLSTAIIVLVRRGNEILLTRAHNFRGTFYGLVAGFVETGETLEECVQRELWEETHIRVCNIRYFGSQPWPYPNGLMVGFTADYAGGELEVDHTELVEAGWFGRDHLPVLPGKVSLARRLIDDWLGK